MKLQEVRVGPRPLACFAPPLGEQRIREAEQRAGAARDHLTGRAFWNVNSTAHGGGVAEMLPLLLAYARGVGIDARWLVIGGEPAFFRLTRRLHHALHGSVGDGSPLGEQERAVYERVLRENARELALLQYDELLAAIARFAVGPSALALADAAMVMREARERLDWPHFLHDARDRRLRSRANTVFAELRRILGIAIPGAVAAELCSDASAEAIEPGDTRRWGDRDPATSVEAARAYWACTRNQGTRARRAGDLVLFLRDLWGLDHVWELPMEVARRCVARSGRVARGMTRPLR